MARDFRTLVALAGMMSCLALPAGAQTAAPEATKWSVDVSLAECTLTGSSGGAAPFQVSILTSTGSSTYSLSLVGKAVPRTPDHERLPVTIVFGPSGRHFERGARGARIDGELGNAIVAEGLGRDVVDAFASASAISLDGKYRVAAFGLPGAAAAIRALDKCERDQLVEWGADPAQFEAGGSKPVATIPRDTWLSVRQRDQIDPRAGGAVDAILRLSVAADGSVDGCTPVGLAPPARVTQNACGALLGRRLFAPARDAAGKPVRGASVLEIHDRVVNSIGG